jgi:hypothetical protein
MATTLRDALSEAFDSADEITEVSPVDSKLESTPEPEAKPERVRAPDGKFAREESHKEELQETPAQADPVQTRKAPSSWKKDYWGKWETLDPDLQSYIEQREGEFAKGVSTYKHEADRGRGFIEAVTPYMPILEQHGLDPVNHVKSLMNAHYALAMGSPEQKQQMFAKLATDYGIDLKGYTGQQDPQQSALLNELNQIKSYVNQFAQTQQQREQQEAVSRIDTFKASAEFFEDVREPMAQLLERGLATDLQQAYEMAIWQTPAVREKLIAKQTQPATQKQSITSKKAAAVSPRSIAPTGQAKGDSKDLRSMLSSAFIEHEAGRL